MLPFRSLHKLGQWQHYVIVLPLTSLVLQWFHIVLVLARPFFFAGDRDLGGGDADPSLDSSCAQKRSLASVEERMADYMSFVFFVSYKDYYAFFGCLLYLQ